MFKFIVKRVLEAIPTLLVLITLSFFLMRFASPSEETSHKNLHPDVGLRCGWEEVFRLPDGPL